MNKTLKKILFSSTILTSVLIAGNAKTVNASTNEEWKARSVEEIKESLKQNINIYTIVKGDTLSAISEASGITINDLVSWNNIANKDLIYAGNKLTFKNDGTVSDSNGNSYVLSEESKANREEIKTQIQNQETKVEQNSQVSTNETSNTLVSQSNTNNSTQPETPNQDTGIEQNVTPSKPGNDGGTETPSEPGNGGGTETPSEPGNGGGTETPSEPGNGGGTETPSEPVWIPEQVIPEEGHWEYETTEVWIPNIVTIVDKPAYTETITYTLITFAADGKQFKLTAHINTPEGQAQYQAVLDHSDWLDEQGLPNNYSTQDKTETIEHPAVTHTEDHGHYESKPDLNKPIWIVDKPEQIIPGHWA